MITTLSCVAGLVDKHRLMNAEAEPYRVGGDGRIAGEGEGGLEADVAGRKASGSFSSACSSFIQASGRPRDALSRLLSTVVLTVMYSPLVPMILAVISNVSASVAAAIRSTRAARERAAEVILVELADFGAQMLDKKSFAANSKFLKDL
jgi:hypothetical protein